MDRALALRERRGYLALDVDLAGYEAEAGLVLFRTKRWEAGVGAFATAPWADWRSPTVGGRAELRF